MKENVQYAYTDKGIKAHTLSYSEYQALSTEEKMNGDLYFIPDKQPEGNPSLIWDKLGTATLDTDADNVSDAVNELNSSIIDLNNNKQDKNMWIRGNGTIYQSRLVSGATLAYWTYTFPNSNINIVIVYCVFKANIALSVGNAIATGFPAGSAGSPVALTGLKTVDNTNVPFYINTSGSLICMGSIAANGWAQCGGIYVSGGAL